MGAQQSQVFVWGSTSTPQRIISSLHGNVCLDVAIGGNHNAVVLANGDLYTWGSNKNGQLGHKRQNATSNSLDEPAVPRVVSFLSKQLIKVRYVSCGEAHTAALAVSGRLYTWGCAQNGRLGREGPHNVPTAVDTLATLPVLSVACGGYHTTALTETGRAYSWGLGAEGRLGHGNEFDQMSPLAVEIGSNLSAMDCPPVKQIVSGGHHTIAIVAGKSGTPPAVYSWGGGSFGKLGHGDEASQNRPKIIQLFSSSSLDQGDYVVQIAAGGQHSAAILASGALYVWGQSSQGRLGLPGGTPGNVRVPTRVPGMGSACRVSCGEQHTCVVTEIAELYYCGLRHSRAEVARSFRKADFFEKSTAVESVDAGEGYTIILARQNRHTVMRTLDRDHHGPFPVSPTAQKTASARLGAGPTVPAPSFAALGGGDDEEGSGDLPSIPTTPLGNSSILNVIEEKRTADELVSTLSRRIQELEGKNRSLEAELKRALGRNTVLEDMLKKTLEPVGDELDEDNGGGSE
jgi:alpha-tubulin suppressor-like RCC1 family protein